MDNKVKTILDESYEKLNEKKDYQDDIRRILKSISKESGVSRKEINLYKNFVCYSGKGWVNGDPLILDTQCKHKDRYSALFARLRDMILTLCKVDGTDLLKPYFDALENEGIIIDISKIKSEYISKDSDVIKNTIADILERQEWIDEINDELYEQDSVKAEEEDFGPRGEYLKLLDMYTKKKQGKDIEDLYDSKFSELNKKLKSYSEIFNEN